MDPWAFLLRWANAPFVISIGIAVVFATLQMTGVLSVLVGDADDGDGDAHAEGDGDAHDGDADGDADGHLPSSFAWQAFAVAFGLAGLGTNAAVVALWGGLPLVSLVVVVPLAALAGVAVRRLLGRALGPLFSGDAQAAPVRTDLVGEAGVVISSRVSSQFGEVRIRTRLGHVVRLVVRSHGEEISEGAAVVVTDVDEETGALYVAPLDILAP